MVSEEAEMKMKGFKNPGLITQGMSVLEDLGVAKPLEGTQYDFEDAMMKVCFKMPEELIWGLVTLTAIITAIGLTAK